MRRHVLSAAVLLSLALRARSAAASHAAVALEYEAKDGGSCSVDGEGELRAAVAARLGYDPFVEPGGVDIVVVHIRRVGSGLEGTIQSRDPSRHARGKASTIVSKSGDCKELAASLAVGIAIAIDPLSITREAPATPPPVAAAPPPPPATPPPPPAEPDHPPVAPRPSVPIDLVVGAAPSLAVGALPSASFGARALVGLSRGIWEIDLEGRFDPPVSVQGRGGSVEASLALGTIAPCLHYSFALACGELSLGALRGTGLGFDHTREENTFYAAAGVRAGVEVGIGRRFALRIVVEGQVPLRPTRLDASGETVWSTPAFEFAAMPMLVGRFP